jgi:hypothetical protein
MALLRYSRHVSHRSSCVQAPCFWLLLHGPCLLSSRTRQLVFSTVARRLLRRGRCSNESVENRTSVRNSVASQPYAYVYIQPFRSLSCSRSIASSKASSPQSAIYCFHFKFSLPFCFLRIIHSCLRLPSRLPVTSILSTVLPSITCYRRQLLREI